MPLRAVPAALRGDVQPGGGLRVGQGPKAGLEDWGTPNELEAAFEQMCEPVQKGLPHMCRDRWWRMYDRDPIMNWLAGNVVLVGDAAHPALQYMAQGAIMAIEDGWVLGEHVRAIAARTVRWTGPPCCRPTMRCARSTAAAC